MSNSVRQDKDRGVIPENHLQKVEANALAYSFAVSLGCKRVLKLFQLCHFDDLVIYSPSHLVLFLLALFGSFHSEERYWAPFGVEAFCAAPQGGCRRSQD